MSKNNYRQYYVINFLNEDNIADGVLGFWGFGVLGLRFKMQCFDLGVEGLVFRV